MEIKSKIVSTVLMQIVLLVATIIVFEICSYFFLPNSIAWNYYYYRMDREYLGRPASYPQYYYQSNNIRGYDIAKSRKGIHILPELSYQIWSNKFGCFDREWQTVPIDYVYFAGDSFTWGFANFENKFATIYEKLTGRSSLKCGVSSSSTRHQFAKFKELLSIIGHPPSDVIVSFFHNDIHDDYLYPNTTVIDGWLVNSVFVNKDGNRVNVTEKWLDAMFHSKSKSRRKRPTCRDSIWAFIKCYSISANLLNSLRRLILPPEKLNSELNNNSLQYNDNAIYPSHYLTQLYGSRQKLSYTDNIFALPNKNVIKAWRNHSLTFGYNLVFVLIPPPYTLQYENWHSELKLFLQSNQIKYIDLHDEFGKYQLGKHKIYWRYDGHFSIKGNHIVARILARELSKL